MRKSKSALCTVSLAHPLSSALKEVIVTGVTTVVSLTLLRAKQGERLAFAYANVLAKRDIS